MAPRAYRGGRRLTVTVLTASLAVACAPSGPAPLLLAVTAVFVVDRAIPVADRGDEKAPGVGRSKWSRVVAILAATGLVVLAGLYFGLPAAIRASNFADKVKQVRAGERLRYSPLNPLALAEPRAEPVRVRWIASNPPPAFGARRALALTYLGQSAGIAVFLNTRSNPRAVYRIPTAAVAVESADLSILP